MRTSIGLVLGVVLGCVATASVAVQPSTTAPQDVDPRTAAQAADDATHWSYFPEGGQEALAAPLRTRLDVLDGLEGLPLLVAWAHLCKEFGLIFDGDVIFVRPGDIPVGHHFLLSAVAQTKETWVIADRHTTIEEILSGESNPSAPVHIPRRAAIRFITADGVSDCPARQEAGDRERSGKECYRSHHLGSRR